VASSAKLDTQHFAELDPREGKKRMKMEWRGERERKPENQNGGIK